MARPHIGLASLRGSLERYAERYELLEVHLDDDQAPKPATLRAWRKKVPPSFVFSVVLPQAASELKPSAALDEALSRALAAAQILEARCILIATPARVTPTEVNKKRLAALAARIPHDAVSLCWEPRGVWEVDEAAKIAAKLGMVLVVDPVREAAPPGSVGYYRIRGLGESARLSPAAIERVVAEVRPRRDAYVVVEAQGAAAVADALKKGAARRPLTIRASKTAARPRAVLRAEDEEQ